MAVRPSLIVKLAVVAANSGAALASTGAVEGACSARRPMAPVLEIEALGRQRGGTTSHAFSPCVA
jgi:hypothetical protein